MSAANPAGQFNTTCWSAVVRAAGQDERGRQALTELCQAYWYPLYAFLRRTGLTAADAEDTVQSFLLRLIEHNLIARADPSRGRFRSFLIAALKQFLAQQHQ